MVGVGRRVTRGWRRRARARGPGRAAAGRWTTPAATTASARPCCTAATCAAASLEIVTSIASGKPSGRASADHERKRGLRTSRTPRPGAKAAIVYGPVPGGGRAADELRRRARREHVGQRHGELVQELGVGPPEVDGDRPRRGVGLDALARGRSAAGCTRRRRRCRRRTARPARRGARRARSTRGSPRAAPACRRRTAARGAAGTCRCARRRSAAGRSRRGRRRACCRRRPGCGGRRRGRHRRATAPASVSLS